MMIPEQPHDSDVQRLLGEHYEEVEMEATLPVTLLDQTRRAVAARARPKYRLTFALAAAAAVVVVALVLWRAPHGPRVTAVHPTTTPKVTPPGPASQGEFGGSQVSAAGGKREKGMYQASVPPVATSGAGRRAGAGSAPAVKPPSGRPLLVVITRRGEARDSSGRSLKVGDQLAAGATVRTGKASYVVMVTRLGSAWALDAASELTVARDGKSAALRRGQAYCRNWQHEFAAVTTPAGNIQLLGTVIDAAVRSKDEVAVTVVEGKARLANAHGAAVVPAGRKAMLIASAAPDSGTATDVLVETAWIEGCLYFTSAERSGAGWNSGVVRHVLIGNVVTDEGMPSADADASPVDHTIVWADSQADVHATDESVLLRRPDGTDLNLTEQAGLSGVNCKPRWSPDGTMISFQHADAKGDKPVCDYGFRVWVMNADGSKARPIAPPDVPSHFGARWTPDGQHLLVEVRASEPTVCRVDLSGQEWERLPMAIGEAVWAPNGHFLVGIAWPRDTQDGKPGTWRQLVLADALGNNPRVLVQHFIADADVAPYYPTPEQKENAPDRNWIADLCYHVGPSTPQWSPSGDQIAFTAALPFDPAGLYYDEQRQVWIYDLNADTLVQVTYDRGGKYALVWSPNPLPVGGGGGGGGGMGGAAH